MTTLRAAMIGVKYSSRPSPTNKATRTTVQTTTFRPRTAPRADGFGLLGRLTLRAALGLAAGLLDRGGAGLSLAARLAFPPGPPSRSLELSAGGSGSAVASLRPPARPSVGCDSRLGRRLAVVLRLGHRTPVSGLRGGVERLALTCKRRHDLGAQHRDVARAHRDDDVARVHRVGHQFGHRGEVRHVVHRLADVLGHRRSADACHRLFPRGVHIEHEHLVGAVQRLSELTRESGCARIQVRLEHHHRATAPALLGHRPHRSRAWRGPRSGGARSRRTPARRARCRPARSGGARPRTRPARRAPTRQSAPTSIAASSAPSALSAMCLPGTDIRITRGCCSAASWMCATAPVFCCSQLTSPPARSGAVVAAVLQHPYPQRCSAFGERRGARVVGAHHQRAAGRQPLDEVVEHRAVCLCAAEEVQMVGLDVGHHRHVRRVFEQ